MKPIILALVEPEVRPHKIHRVMGCMPRKWEVLNNYEDSSLGRIWLGWNPRVWNCQVCSKSMQQITIIGSNKGGLQILLTIVYGSNRWSRRKELWTEMQLMHQQHASLPWAVVEISIL